MGDTSVFRFCKTMNLKGYQEFKMMLSLSLHEGDGKDMERLAGNIKMCIRDRRKPFSRM